jgi:hypothetical protein
VHLFTHGSVRVGKIGRKLTRVYMPKSREQANLSCLQMYCVVLPTPFVLVSVVRDAHEEARWRTG